MTTPDFAKKSTMSKSGVNWKAASPANALTPPAPAATASALGASTTPSISPVISASIKTKATELMVQAYGTKDWILSTRELFSAEPPLREQTQNALQYLIKMNWASQSADPNVFVLTKDGARQVEKSLTF